MVEDESPKTLSVSRASDQASQASGKMGSKPRAKGTLIGIKAKLQWADAHLDQLKDSFFASPKKPSNKVTYHVDSDGLYASISVKEPAPEWALMAGNLIHQIRASLDHLVFQLVLQHPDKQLAFIRSRGEKKLRRAIHFPI